MLHKSISHSIQVNRLSPEARLLFTWMIPHADDEGRIKGEADYIKAVVVPMTDWSFEQIEKYLEEIANSKLINRWRVDEDWFIEFVKWTNYQHIRPERFKDSVLPSYSKKNDTQLATNRQPSDNHLSTQSSQVESSEVESSVVEESAERNISNKSFADLYKKIRIEKKI